LLMFAWPPNSTYCAVISKKDGGASALVIRKNHNRPSGVSSFGQSDMSFEWFSYSDYPGFNVIRRDANCLKLQRGWPTSTVQGTVPALRTTHTTAFIYACFL